MTTTLKRKLKPFLWPIAITLLLGWYFADNFKGYYRFKALCSEQGGLKVYQPLERDVGWFEEDGRMNEAYMLNFEAVAFIRYHNEAEGHWYDVYRSQKLKVGDAGFAQQPADLNKPVVYQRKWSGKDMPNEIRLGISTEEFIDLRTSEVVVTYTQLGYRPFEKGLFGGHGGMGCPELGGGTDPKTGKRILSNGELAVLSAFKS